MRLYCLLLTAALAAPTFVAGQQTQPGAGRTVELELSGVEQIRTELESLAREATQGTNDPGQQRIAALRAMAGAGPWYVTTAGAPAGRTVQIVLSPTGAFQWSQQSGDRWRVELTESGPALILDAGGVIRARAWVVIDDTVETRGRGFATARCVQTVELRDNFGITYAAEQLFEAGALRWTWDHPSVVDEPVVRGRELYIPRRAEHQTDPVTLTAYVTIEGREIALDPVPIPACGGMTARPQIVTRPPERAPCAHGPPPAPLGLAFFFAAHGQGALAFHSVPDRPEVGVGGGLGLRAGLGSVPHYIVALAEGRLTSVFRYGDPDASILFALGYEVDGAIAGVGIGPAARIEVATLAPPGGTGQRHVFAAFGPLAYLTFFRTARVSLDLAFTARGFEMASVGLGISMDLVRQ